MPSNTVVDWKFPSELYGAAKALSVGFIVKPVGEPDAGNPHVRFDERGGKRDDVRVATAPNPDSTENRGGRWYTVCGRWGKNRIRNQDKKTAGGQ